MTAIKAFLFTGLGFVSMLGLYVVFAVIAELYREAVIKIAYHGDEGAYERERHGET